MPSQCLLLSPVKPSIPPAVDGPAVVHVHAVLQAGVLTGQVPGEEYLLVLVDEAGGKGHDVAGLVVHGVPSQLLLRHGIFHHRNSPLRRETAWGRSSRWTPQQPPVMGVQAVYQLPAGSTPCYGDFVSINFHFRVSIGNNVSVGDQLFLNIASFGWLDFRFFSVSSFFI